MNSNSEKDTTLTSQGAAERAVPAMPEFDEIDDELIDHACSAGALYRVDLMRAWSVIREAIAQPAPEPGHVQKPAENEHVPADVSKNRQESNMPTPAQDGERCAICGDGDASLLVMRHCNTCGSDYAGQAESKINAALDRAARAPVGAYTQSPLGEDAILGIRRSLPMSAGNIEFARAIEFRHGIGDGSDHKPPAPAATADALTAEDDAGALNFVTLREFRAIARAVLARWGAAPTGEPVATIKSWTNGSYWRNYKVEWHRNDLPEGAQLYTAPQPAEPPRVPQPMPALTQLTERGATAWAGVDAQALREGREPLTDEQIDAAAKKLAECMDYPWEHMPEKGRDEMRKHAKAVMAAGGIKHNKGGQDAER